MKKLISSFPDKFPIVNGYDEWGRFFHKALMGSYKAADILNYAEEGFMIYTFGQDIDYDEKLYDRKLQEKFIDYPPFVNEQDLIEKLVLSSSLDVFQSIPKKMKYERQNYHDMMNNDFSPSTIDLIADSVYHSFINWNYEFYKSTIDAINDDNYVYNSLDVAAALIMLTSSFIDEIIKCNSQEIFIFKEWR